MSMSRQMSDDDEGKMLQIAIPGRDPLTLRHLVLDLNGTLAVHGPEGLCADELAAADVVVADPCAGLDLLLHRRAWSPRCAHEGQSDRPLPRRREPDGTHPAGLQHHRERAPRPRVRALP